MARIRAIKPEFFTSPDIAALSFPARQLFQAMWCWADDFGIGETNLNGLLGFAFHDDDGFTRDDLRGFCAEIAAQNGATFYTVRGRHYYAIVSWEKHQKLESRASRRKYPTPDDPDAVPDQRIYGCADPAPDSRRKTGAESREAGAGTGNREQGTGNRRPPYPPNDEPAPQRAVARRTTGAEKARAKFAATPARSLDAYRIAEAFSASLPVPIEDNLLACIGTQIDKCLNRGIPPHAIAAGLKAWTDSDSWSPTQIPNFVHKANNCRHVGKPTEKALGHEAALAELLQEVTTL